MTAQTKTGRLGPVFNQPTGFTLNVDNPRRVSFTADKATRTIKGLALPFGDVAETGGRKYRFTKGVLKWGKVRLLAGHDWSQLLGTATFEETDAGLVMTATVANTRAGDDALALADSGALDGLSVGLAEQLRTRLGQDGVHDVLDGSILETSLTPMPAFQNAQIQSVALQKQPAPAAPAQPDTGAQFDLGADPRFAQLAAEVNQIGAQMDFIAALPQQPAGPAAFVREEAMYRFAGDTPAPSGFDFAADMLAAATRGDQAAFERVAKFTADVQAGRVDNPSKFISADKVREAFATTANVAGNLPTQYDPSLFLGDAPFPKTPMFDYFNRGARSSWLPFNYGVLTRATVPDLTDHVEGVDPANDNIASTMHAPVAPAPVSGKVHITREVGELGGNPDVSALVWVQYDISLATVRETKTTALVTGSAPTALNAAALAAGANGATLGAHVRKGLAALPFSRDGQSIARGFAQVDFFTALATADSTTGEPLFPIGPVTNRQGSSESQYSALTIGGYPVVPGIGLAASSANAANSYFAGPNAVHVWSSGLTRLSMLNESVEGWDLGAWSWFAGVLYNLAELRVVSYDPAP